MEIKINKDVRNYKESVFFGLSTRQFFCSMLAVGLSVGLYFALKNYVGKEAVSWICMLAAAPIAAAGFFRYNGLNLEQFIWAFVRSEFLCSGKRKYEAENYYLLLLEEVNNHDSKTRCSKQGRQKQNDQRKKEMEEDDV